MNYHSQCRFDKSGALSPTDSLVVNQSWFSALTFVVKIATLVKPQATVNIQYTYRK